MNAHGTAKQDPPLPRPQLFSIELRPHKGIMRTAEGRTLEVEHPQWMVYASTSYFPLRQIGFMAKHHGSDLACLACIKLIATLDREILCEALSERVGWPVALIIPGEGKYEPE